MIPSQRSPAHKKLIGCSLGCLGLIVLVFVIPAITAAFKTRAADDGTTEGKVRAVMLQAVGTDCDPRVMIVNGNHADVTFRASENLTANLMRYGVFKDICTATPRIFENAPELQSVGYRAEAELVDVRGNKSMGPVAIITISRQTSDACNWENILTDNLPQIADNCWVAPALQ